MNEKFLEAQELYKNQIKNTENKLREAEKQCDLIRNCRINARETMLNIFIENFSGSDEDVEFLLDYSQSGDSESVYYFRKKYLAGKGLTNKGFYKETNQIALMIDLSGMTKKEIKNISNYMLKQAFKVIKPLKEELVFGQDTITDYRLLKIKYTGSYKLGRVYFIEKNNLYTVVAISERNGNEIIIDWNDDLTETLIKAKDIDDYKRDPLLADDNDDYGYGLF